MDSKTAIALKTLRNLGYEKESTWNRGGGGRRGGVKEPLGYFAGELDKVTRKERAHAGEDWWDHCVILLAVHSFLGASAIGLHARHIAEEWQAIYKDASERSNQWFGPAFLAAMIDVVAAWGAADKAVVDRMVSTLLETEESEGTIKQGYYPNEVEIRPRDQWQTGLVLCTLCAHARFTKVEQAVNRTVRWLLIKQTEENRWSAENGPHDPMYTARVLKGLVAARTLVSDEAKANLDHAIKSGNEWMAAYQALDGLFVDDKSTIVVLEYLSSLPVKTRSKRWSSSSTSHTD